jgi:hypothetical protein
MPTLDEIAQATVPLMGPSDNEAVTVSLFSGLTLPANTYFLTLTGSSASWNNTNVLLPGFIGHPSVVTAAGVTRDSDYVAYPDVPVAYTPSNSFSDVCCGQFPPFLLYDVTTTPEPSTTQIQVLGLLFLLYLGARGRSLFR